MLDAFILIAVFLLIAVIVVVVLFALGYFKAEDELDREKERLKSEFSLQPVTEKSKHATKDSKSDDFILSNDTKLSCSEYSFTQKTYSENNININDAIVWNKDSSLIVTADGVGKQIKLIKPTSSDTRNTSWIFNNFTFCLKDNNKECMFNNNGKITLNNLGASDSFLWTVQPALKSPNCSNQT